MSTHPEPSLIERLRDELLDAQAELHAARMQYDDATTGLHYALQSVAEVERALRTAERMAAQS